MVRLRTTYAPAPGTERGKGLLLGGDPQGSYIAYCNGRSVVLRNLDNPVEVIVYGEHSHATTVARFSPSGVWVASGDVAGNVRVWARKADNGHKLKFEIRALSGSIDDLQWSADSQRILVSGNGRGTQLVRCFMWDSGNNVGDFVGHGGRVLSCDIRSVRPFRVATGGEDRSSNFYEGPPFRFSKSNTEHSNFINCVRYSPDGSKFITVSSDRKGLIFDGKTGDKIGHLSEENGHTGSIYAASWSPDSKQILTVSADKTAKVWDISSEGSGTVNTTFSFSESPTIDHMQMGCLWLQKHLITVSLNGDINYLSLTNPALPSRILEGHSKSITAMAVSSNQNGAFSELYSSSYDGVMLRWQLGVGSLGRVVNKGLSKASVRKMKVLGRELVICAGDHTVRKLPLPGDQDPQEEPVELKSQPRDFSASSTDPPVAISVTEAGLVLLRGLTVVARLSLDYEATATGVSPSGDQAVVGSSTGKLYVYSITGDTLAQEAVLERHRAAITAVEYSPDGTMIASGDQKPEVVVWDSATREVKVKNMLYHTARISCLAWSPDSASLASGSVDTSAIVWDVSQPVSARRTIPRSHLGGVTAMAFRDEKTLLTAGEDACIREWALS